MCACVWMCLPRSVLLLSDTRELWHFNMFYVCVHVRIWQGIRWFHSWFPLVRKVYYVCVCVVVQKNIFMSRLTCSSSSISSGDILSISPAVPHSVSPTSLRGGNASLFTMIESKHTMMIHCHGSHCLCDVLLMPLRRCECSYPQAGRKAGKAAELQIAWISRWGLHGMQLQILLQILQKQFDNQMQVSTNDSCNSV